METHLPEISIVTPSYNMLPYLKLCSASVRDQGPRVEHIVMDGNSTDGTAAWLEKESAIISVSEKDNGMYHALNKAIARASAEIVGHLNCDEQYLPEVLKFVISYFEQNPRIDFIAGDFLITDEQGELLAYRKFFQPRWQYFFSNYLYANTCTLFYRKKIFNTCKFDESYKSIADVIFLYDVLRKGFRGAHIRKYFSTFTYSGTNLSLNPISKIEKKRFDKYLPFWYQVLKPLYFTMFFVERILNNTYREKSPLLYSIYTKENPGKRTVKSKIKPTFRLRFNAIAQDHDR
ncbi:MAG TPA: glycosyltransferase [Flavitalea sp.]|nr:glycosyltransferase [Flavitalea sp.]